MSQPLIDLQRLLAGRQTTTGRVVALNGGMVRVVTAQGVVEVVAETGLAVGDRVTVRDGRAVKSQGSADAPVVFV
ncbi:MAG: hypothetical protein HQL56_17505 [Magnetococcales bacterium]|nr:hypothetical protein [Magnetococcales bacterium]